MAKIDLSLKLAWRRFHECLRLEGSRKQLGAPTGPTMSEVHRSQFEWLLSHAADNQDLLAGEDPREVAIYWGRQCGIAPRVMAKVLGMENSNAIRQSLHRFKAHLEKAPTLRHLASVP